ncbi:MAG: glutaredoxin family protein [Wenzhouxiangellaceae bacterium]|nr:glutaredoxin family protein [Wenzhouxiangellaceae bacterium]
MKPTENGVPMAVVFYTREPCELCEKAWRMLSVAGLDQHVTPIHIEDEAELLQRYGEQVPVVRNEETGEKLAWPFTASQVRELAGLE